MLISNDNNKFVAFLYFNFVSLFFMLFSHNFILTYYKNKIIEGKNQPHIVTMSLSTNNIPKTNPKVKDAYYTPLTKKPTSGV